MRMSSIVTEGFRKGMWIGLGVRFGLVYGVDLGCGVSLGYRVSLGYGVNLGYKGKGLVTIEIRIRRFVMITYRDK